MNTLELGKSYTLPWNVANGFSGEVNSRTSSALISSSPAGGSDCKRGKRLEANLAALVSPSYLAS